MDYNKEELIALLNEAVKLEHAARIQYLAHAELIKGGNSGKISERLREIASDEEKHEGIFRALIGDYLGGEPTMEVGPTHGASDTRGIFQVNRKAEKEAIEIYRKLYRKVVESKEALLCEFETLEHQIRHVISDEQEHAAELSRLLGE